MYKYPEPHNASLDDNGHPGLLLHDLDGNTIKAQASPSGALAVSTPSGTRMATDPLGKQGTARRVTAGATSASIALTSTCTRMSLLATGGDIRYVIGVGPQTATATSHLILEGERLEWLCDAGSTVAVLRNASIDGVLEISEIL